MCRKLCVESCVSKAYSVGGGRGQPYLNLFKPRPILEAEGVIGLNRVFLQKGVESTVLNIPDHIMSRCYLFEIVGENFLSRFLP